MIDHLNGRWPLNFEETENGLATMLRDMLNEYEGARARLAKQANANNDAIARAMGWQR